ncbi:linear gramicidin synthase subunit B [Clostridium puniceum]|uniref:Linear gramicidin synthase subunit B n=1 Tax=Clostridium puniceum TaxID=29367 RepID=A0A1S8T7M7_9CLOT|nr:non-ribosomal peptide synthetase [Clostridium puniceum]OOM73624.1 linear gramicidin synthase subunit B [Clostridium puniceum]
MKNSYQKPGDQMEEDMLYPLSFEQNQLLNLGKGEIDNPCHIVQAIISIEGNVNIDLIKKSWTYIVKTHDSFRINFIKNNGKIYQEFVEIEGIDFEVIDLTKLEKLQQEEYIKNEVSQEINKSFKLDEDLLFRIKALKVLEKEYKFIFTANEIIIDEHSLYVIANELKKYYLTLSKNKNMNFNCQYSFREHSICQNNSIASGNLNIQKKYWENMLSEDLPVFDICTDKKREMSIAYKGDFQSVLLDCEVSNKLKKLAIENKTSLSMILLTAFRILLYDYTEQEDIIIGLSYINQNTTTTKDFIGCLTNILPLRIRNSKDYTFSELLNYTKKVWDESYSNSSYPLFHIQKGIKENCNDNIFQVILKTDFKHADRLYDTNKDDDIHISCTILKTGFTKYPLTLYAKEEDEQIYLELSYLVDLFDKSFIQRLIKNYEILINSILKDSNMKISELDYLSFEEKDMLVNSLNNTYRNYNYDLSVSQLFEKIVEEFPKKVAYIYKNNTINYIELNARANKLANYLKKKDVKQDDYVAICVDKSFEMVVSILAIIKLGAAYVPLDPEHPISRLEEIIKDTNVKHLLVKSDTDKFETFNGVKVLIDKEKNLISHESEDNVNLKFEKDNTINIIYTSSSTGKAKGVKIGNRAVLNRLNWMWQEYPFSHNDVVSFHKSYCLVAAIWECFGGLLKGTPTLLLERKDVLNPVILWRKLVENKVSYFLSNPALIRGILKQGKLHPGEWNSLKIATTSAEPISVNLIEEWYEVFTNVPLLNLYGASECSSNALVYDTRFMSSDHNRVPIGRGLSNTKIFILNKDEKLVPYGAVGELCISGDCVAQGYLNLDELNREKFIKKPSLGIDNEVLYKTGDLARYMEDGNVELIGRKDNQVKIRGFKIEIENIELTLQRYEGIGRCAVKVFENENGDKSMIAYIESKDVIPVSKVRQFLLKYLPDYMLPVGYVFLDKMPLTPTGKVNRKNLKEPIIDEVAVYNDFVPPNTVIEKFLANIWSELLGRQKVGIQDDFFELGGHSLIAMELASGIYNRFNVEISVSKIFEHSTISMLSKDLEVLVSGKSLENKENIKKKIIQRDTSLTLGQYLCFSLGEHMVEPEYFNIVRVCEVGGDFDSNKLKQVLRYLWKMHDSLRARFIKQTDVWHQIIDEPNDQIPFKEFKFENISINEERDIIKEYNEKLQHCFDISKGPLGLVAYLNFGSNRPGRVLIILHHLISDGYSMVIFMKNLERGYKQLAEGKQINLIKERTTLREWCEILDEYSSSKKQLNEIEYWSSLPWDQVAKLSADYPENENEGSIRSMEEVVVGLDIEETKILSRQIQIKLNIEATNVLIFALTKAISEATKKRWVELNVVSHGRDIVQSEQQLNLANTIGFFAYARSLVLKQTSHNDLLHELKLFNEQINNVPNNGYGYNILSTFAHKDKIKKIPFVMSGIMLNYRGEFNEISNEKSVFKITNEFPHLSFNPESKIFRPNRMLIMIDGAVSSKHLVLSWKYSNKLLKRESIETLANRTIDILKEVISITTDLY